ncbi:DUF4406 domain-containing protein [Brucepastera parasyntrophica]|uniref:DUF4406 domain-containing protein n=1 Tax=Brucepastera parasyntrophica TaxID=2880008 RepID=UPI00210EAB5D|nr:DUF4406 domain-containing protein [Brucepastera parasyntrophica]ULQ59217.1 DUF4406 domain-containing protein [Brucepastera parasyntrophica]
MKLYLSGKITGNQNYKEIFTRARVALTDAGFEVFDPSLVSFTTTPGWGEAMKTVLQGMLQCDAVALIDNWMESKGSKVEYNLAATVGMIAMPIEWWIQHYKTNQEEK